MRLKDIDISDEEHSEEDGDGEPDADAGNTHLGVNRARRAACSRRALAVQLGPIRDMTYSGRFSHLEIDAAEIFPEMPIEISGPHSREAATGSSS